MLGTFLQCGPVLQTDACTSRGPDAGTLLNIVMTGLENQLNIVCLGHYLGSENEECWKMFMDFFTSSMKESNWEDILGETHIQLCLDNARILPKHLSLYMDKKMDLFDIACYLLCMISDAHSGLLKSLATYWLPLGGQVIPCATHVGKKLRTKSPEGQDSQRTLFKKMVKSR